MLLSAVKIGGNLAEKTLETKERYDKIVESADAKTQEWKEKYYYVWKEKYYKYFPHRKDKQKIDEIEREYGKIVEAEDFKISDWRERFEKLVEIKDSSVERLLKAFPQLRSVSYSEAMDTLKIRWAEMRHKNKGSDSGGASEEEEEDFP